MSLIVALATDDGTSSLIDAPCFMSLEVAQQCVTSSLRIDHEGIDPKRTGEGKTSHITCSQKAFRSYVSVRGGYSGRSFGTLGSSMDNGVSSLGSVTAAAGRSKVH